MLCALLFICIYGMRARNLIKEIIVENIKYSDSDEWTLDQFYGLARLLDRASKILEKLPNQDYSKFFIGIENDEGAEIADLLDKCIGNRTDWVADFLHYHQNLNPAIDTLKDSNFPQNLNRWLRRVGVGLQ